MNNYTSSSGSLKQQAQPDSVSATTGDSVPFPVSSIDDVTCFLPAIKGAAALARRGIEHSDWGLLPVVTLKPGESIRVRCLPSFADPKLAFLLLVQHRWPCFEYNRLKVISTCPLLSSPLLIGEHNSASCPACEASVEIIRSALVYALTDDARKAICLKFNEQQLPVLNMLLRPECFGLSNGRELELWNDNWTLRFKLLKPQPVSPEAFEMAVGCGDLHVRPWTVRPDLLQHMAQAKHGWEKSGEKMPFQGQYVRLHRLLPDCTFIRMPWGFKAPQDLGWQNTPFELMLTTEYCSSLDEGNIGLLCGRDQTAVDKGLVPDQIIIGLDADESMFARELLALNPWLAETFAVEGGRGMKWFFAIAGEGMARCLQSTKIKRRDAEGMHDPEVGDWLSTGKQGVIWGLHPSGKMYTPNPKPLRQVDPREFRLPKDCYLAAGQTKTSTAKSLYYDSKRKRGGLEGESLGDILDVSRLENVHQTSKGIQAACPACRAEGKDTAGDNLLIYADGRYSCARFIRDDPAVRHEHNQAVYAHARIVHDEETKEGDSK